MLKFGTSAKAVHGTSSLLIGLMGFSVGFSDVMGRQAPLRSGGSRSLNGACVRFNGLSECERGRFFLARDRHPIVLREEMRHSAVDIGGEIGMCQANLAQRRIERAV